MDLIRLFVVENISYCIKSLKQVKFIGGVSIPCLIASRDEL